MLPLTIPSSQTLREGNILRTIILKVEKVTVVSLYTMKAHSGSRCVAALIRNVGTGWR
jgi:hypothetical protein